MADDVVIRVRNLRKSYETAGEVTEVLHGLDFDIKRNEFVAILGASGTGKTTLLNILGGLDYADSGSVLVDDNEIVDMSEAELSEYRRLQVGFIFQFYSLLPSLSVEENVRYAAELSEDPMDVQEALEKVGMWELRDHLPSQLSSGQQQRVAIARALAKNPSIILADEPTGALDLKTSREVLMAMEDVVKNGDATIVLITHNPEICRIVDRTMVMSQGSIESFEENKNAISAADLEW